MPKLKPVQFGPMQVVSAVRKFILPIEDTVVHTTEDVLPFQLNDHAKLSLLIKLAVLKSTGYVPYNI